MLHMSQRRIAELISVCVQGKQAFWQDTFEAAIRRRQRRRAVRQPCAGA